MSLVPAGGVLAFYGVDVGAERWIARVAAGLEDGVVRRSLWPWLVNVFPDMYKSVIAKWLATGATKGSELLPPGKRPYTLLPGGILAAVIGRNDAGHAVYTLVPSGLHVSSSASREMFQSIAKIVNTIGGIPSPQMLAQLVKI